MAHSYFSFPYFSYFTGFCALFLPSFNFIYIFDRKLKTALGLFKIALLTLLTTLTILPTVLYITGVTIGNSNNSIVTNSLLLAIWFISIIMLYLNRCFEISLSPSQKERLFNLVPYFVIVLVVYIIAYSSYFLLPEFDSYVYLGKIDDILSKSGLINDSRPFFLQLLLLTNNATGIPYFWIFKLFIPLLTLSYFFVGYKLALEFKLYNPFTKIVASLSYLSSPILFAESFYARPQTILIALFPVVIYLVYSLLENKRNLKNIYWFMLILFAVGISFKIHELFFVLFLIGCIGFLLFIKEQLVILKTRFWLILIICSYFYLIAEKVMSLLGTQNIKNILLAFTMAFKSPKFDLWFLDGYRDFIGIYVSWPGNSWLLYYGYISGGFFLLLLFSLIIRKKKTSFKNNLLVICSVSFIIFFSMAEIFPRLGIAFLVDRSWIFIVSTFAIITPLILSKIEPRKKEILFFSLIIITSIIAIIAFLYIKKGWVTKAEIDAARYLKTTKENSLVISQPGNTALINYYGKKRIVIPNEIFFLNPSDDYISQSINQNLWLDSKSYAELLKAKDSSLQNLNSVFEKYFLPECSNLCKIKYSDSMIESVLFVNNVAQKEEDILNSIPKNKGDIFVLYSLDKLSGYYSRYSYWQKENMANANLDFFKKNENFEEVFNNGRVLIWKYNNDATI